MLTTPPKSSPLRQRRTDEWVPELCEQFSNATGWPLRYVPASHLHSGDTIGPLDPCWQAELRDGQQLVGHLRLDPPHGRSDDRTFAAVSQLSKVLADLVSRVFLATRRLEIQTHELLTPVGLGLTAPQGQELLGTFKQLLRAGLQLTGFRSACFFLLNPAQAELRLHVSHHLEPGDVPQPVRPLCAEPPDLPVVADGTRLVLRRGDRQSAEWLPAEAALGFCLPVQAACGVLGTLWFFDRRLRPIAAREKQLLDELATQVATLLERAVFQRESSTHQRLRHELLSLTEYEGEAPVKALRRPRFEASWRVSSRFEIGGDLCDVVEVSNHESALLIGDATGNSVPAAVVMTAVHGALAALLSGDHDEARQTARVLGRVNQSLFRTRRLPHFMSLVYGVLDEQTLRLTYSNAGHPSPLLLRNGEVISLDTRGLLLGIIQETDYPFEVIELQPHDLLILYSDGISEARNTQEQLFGREGVLRSLGPDPQTAETATVLHRVWNRLTTFAVPGQADDRSLMLLRVLSE